MSYDFNAKIGPPTIRDSEVLDVVSEGVVEGGGNAGSSGRNDALKLNMIKSATLTCGGTGTNTAVLFASLGLPNMLDTGFLVIGGAEVGVISSKATTGFTFAHVNASSAVFSVLIVGNWNE